MSKYPRRWVPVFRLPPNGSSIYWASAEAKKLRDIVTCDFLARELPTSIKVIERIFKGVSSCVVSALTEKELDELAAAGRRAYSKRMNVGHDDKEAIEYSESLKGAFAPSQYRIDPNISGILAAIPDLYRIIVPNIRQITSHEFQNILMGRFAIQSHVGKVSDQLLNIARHHPSTADIVASEDAFHFIEMQSEIRRCFRHAYSCDRN